MSKINYWAKFKLYAWNQLYSFDLATNAVLGGDPEETISSRMGKLIERDKCRFCIYACRFLDLFEKDHCAKSVQRDRGRREVIK